MTPGNYDAMDDPLTYRIIGCAIRVHRALGPGLLESLYEECIKVELARDGMSFRSHPRIAVPYEGRILDREFRPDFVIENEVILELKSVANFLPVHQAQMLTYMKLSRIERGLLINFNVAVLVKGIKRLILTEAPRGASVL